MPSDYVIDAEYRLVRSRLWGGVTDADLFDHQRRLAADPKFSSDYSQLIDCRDVTSAKEVTAFGIQNVAQRHLYDPHSRRAIVANRPDVFGLGRMFEGYSRGSGSDDTIRVFWVLEDALAWLEVPAHREVLRVLVVDDDADILTFADLVLSNAGYEVVVAPGGPEALRIVEAQRRFDVFVIDVLMPQMYGDELARQLRQKQPDVKVLYFTGYSDHLFKEKLTLWANEAYLDKPVTSPALLEAVSLLLFGHTHGSGGGPGPAA